MLLGRDKFSKTTKLHEPTIQVQFLVFENLQVPITPNCKRYHFVTCYNVHEKTSERVKKGKISKAYVCYL